MLALPRAAHLQPALAVTGITTALAVSAGGSARVVLAVGCGQLSVGWCNDYVDRDRDARSGRRDKPLAVGSVSPALVIRAAVVALALAVGLSFWSGWRAGLVHVGALAAAWAYNLRLKSTVLSPLPYAVAFGLLPAFVTLGVAGHPLPPWWAVTAGALLGVGAHFVNTLPDSVDDVREGIRGLPQRAGRRWSLLVAAAFLAGAATLLALAGATAASYAALAVALAAVAGVVVAALTGHERAAWPLTLLTAGLCVALLLARGGSLVHR